MKKNQAKEKIVLVGVLKKTKRTGRFFLRKNGIEFLWLMFLNVDLITSLSISRFCLAVKENRFNILLKF